MTTTDLTPDSQAPGSGDKAGPSRRTVLLTTGTVVAAAAVTAACGSSSDGAGSTTTAGGGGSSSTASSGGGAGTTVSAADVPVGGGVILKDVRVVVTQPTAGTYKGFTAVCTHQGCIVSDVKDGSIDCACHGSKFSAADGSVQQGPATGALAEVTVSEAGGTITISS
ncbi:MAG: Rieske (2Fe-2S) protein [Actinobacteria bacterium]|jgi:Rieske Fe-S protein|nr:Rieske (2Fe-2S) protein [Actinomycetota bacterium]